MIAEIIINIDNIIVKIIPYFSMVLAGGIVLYFDGLIFSGGKGWVKGLKNTFETSNKGFMYFLANIIILLIAGYLLQILIQNILFTNREYFIPLILQLMLIIYVYYLHTYTKKGFLRSTTIVFQIVILVIFHLFSKII